MLWKRFILFPFLFSSSICYFFFNFLIIYTIFSFFVKFSIYFQFFHFFFNFQFSVFFSFFLQLFFNFLFFCSIFPQVLPFSPSCVQFSLIKLEYMCVHYIWVSVNHCNVLRVLQYANELQLDFIQVSFQKLCSDFCHIFVFFCFVLSSNIRWLHEQN